MEAPALTSPMHRRHLARWRGWVALVVGLLIWPSGVAWAQGVPAETAAPRDPEAAPTSKPDAVSTAAPISAPADFALSWSSRWEALAVHWPGLGELRGPVRVTLALHRVAQPVGRPLALERRILLHGERVYLGPLLLGEATLLVVTPPGQERSRLTLDVRGPLATVAHAEAEGVLELALHRDLLRWTGGPLQAKVRVEGIRLEELTRVHPGLALAGQVDLEVDVAGAAERPTVTARMAGRELRWRGEPVGEVAATGKLAADGMGTLEARWGAGAEPRATLSLEVPVAVDLYEQDVRWLDAREHRVELTAPRLDPELLRPLWRAPVGADFQFGLRVQGQGTLDRFDLKGEMRGVMRSRGQPETPWSLEVQADPRRQVLDLRVGEQQLELHVAIAGNLVALRRAHAPAEAVGLTGRLKLALPLPLLAPYLPARLAQPQGILAGQVEVAGTLGQPDLQGPLATQGAAVTLVDLNQRLTELTLRAQLAQDTLKVEELRATAGPGRVEGQGQLRWQATAAGEPHEGLWSRWQLDSAWQLKVWQLPVIQDLLPIALVDGGGDVIWNRKPGETELQLRLARTEVELTDQHLPRARAIPTNPTVRLLDWATGLHAGPAQAAAGSRLRVEAILMEPLRLHSRGVDLSWSGRLVLERDGDLVRVEGGFDPVGNGVFQLFDHQFQLRSGRFTLMGGNLAGPLLDGSGGPTGTGAASLRDPDRPPVAWPLEPILDLAAMGRAVDTWVQVRVRGPWRRPELSLLSSPALPEYQILTLLITGRVDAVDERDGEVRRQVARLVDRFHNPSLSRQLFDRLGVDKIGMGFGSSVTEPIVTVGKQINRQLYVETVYHHNAPPDVNGREGHVEYRFNPRWTLDTTFGDAGEGGAGVFWRASFGGPDETGSAAELEAASRRPDRDQDQDGLPDLQDRCHLEPEDRDGWLDEDGCPDPDNDEDGLADGQDRCPDQAEVQNGFEDEDGCPDAPPIVHTDWSGQLLPLHFPAGAAAVAGPDAAFVLAVAKILKDYPELQVEILGHGDDQGTEPRNLIVSRQRAESLVNLLRRGGLDRQQVSSQGLGFTAPLDPARTEEARAHNRRVEVRIVGP